ncbi:hypothetical protein [Schlegelella aquatica]|uniref:hypothetical protein n=1 Tax=Caldimonas aquatica TaxID=376175 RepID=UPI00375069FD
MNIRNFFGGFVEVANGLASILSLGYLAPRWDLRYYGWLARRDFERFKNQCVQQKENRND